VSIARPPVVPNTELASVPETLISVSSIFSVFLRRYQNNPPSNASRAATTPPM
jgi:hypothetical protein